MSIALSGLLSLKQETAYGVEATPDVAAEIRSESISEDNNLITPQYISGKVGDTRVLAGPLSAGGGIELDMFPEGIFPWLLKGVFGQVTTTSPAAGVYQHVFTPRTGLSLPSFTTQVNALGGTTNWLGCRFGNFGVSISPAEMLSVTADIVAQYGKEGTSVYPTVSALDPFVATDAEVEWNDILNVDFENINFSLNNGLISVPTLNHARWAGKASATTFRAEGSFNLEFDNMAMVRQMWGADAATLPQACIEPQKLTIDVTSGCQEIGSTGYFYRTIWEFPEVFLKFAKRNLTGANDRVMVAVEWIARVSNSLGYAVKATVVNSVSGYPDP